MHAVIATRPGPPAVLEPVELPNPTPVPGQVLIAVEVAATTFIDTQVRAGGGPRPLDPDEFPLVLGNGVGGTVVAVGDDLDSAWLGTPVVATTGGRGGYATCALAAVSDLHRIPQGVDVSSAVALLADGRTALALVRAARIVGGETVVVTAAGGGVGSLLVQLAHAASAIVVALAGAPQKLDHALDLGASVAIDYRRSDWRAVLDRLLGGHQCLDVVFDGVGGPTSASLVARMARSGRYLPHGAASGAWGEVDLDTLAARGITTIPLTALDHGPADLHGLVEQALALTAGRVLRPTIGQTFPLMHAADVHAAIEARATLGKTLLVI